MRHRLKPVSALIALALALAACAGPSPETASSEIAGPEPQVRTLVDMEGRSVEVPREVDSVVTLGSVPVLNSFLFALGKGDVIANGLPNFALGGRWQYQYVFAPAIETLPQAENADRAPQLEDILKMEPDVVLTMSPDAVAPLEAVGLNVMVLQWRDATDVKNVVDLLGELLDEPDRARAYSEYFDTTTAAVAAAVAGVPVDQRRSALSLNPKSMTRPHLIAEWWIAQAGGRSVTAGSTEETLPLNVEQIIAANPDVLFVSSPADVEAVYADERFAPITAVANREVYAVPIAAHTWGNRTSEQPLTVYWAASKLYPELITADDVTAQVKDFYATIFHTDLTDAQAAEIASGS